MSEKSDIVVPFQSEKQLALELKKGIQQKLEDLACEMDKAAFAGFAVTFNVQMGPNGRYNFGNFTLAKHY